MTGFFRDPEAFDFLGNGRSDLIEQGKENGHKLRIWSAGCATGEEAYSLVMLLADHLGEDFSEWNIKIFATDLAADAITFARRGLYPENVLKDLPDDYRERFFERIDHGLSSFKAATSGRYFRTTGHQPWRTLSTNRSGILSQSPDLP